MPDAVLVTCEHGGHDVPAGYEGLFEGAAGILASHRGWDPGALELAGRIATRLGAPLVATTTTRLLVEVNRSPGHRQVLSEFARALDPAARERLLAEHYEPYRRRVEEAVRSAARPDRPVVHLSIHTFTPVLGDDVRDFDIGILYDPRRPAERRLAAAWRKDLRSIGLGVRRNAPYRGTSDGLTTFLRRRFAGDRYLGLELEVNQRHPLGEGRAWSRLQDELAASVARITRGPSTPGAPR